MADSVSYLMQHAEDYNCFMLHLRQFTCEIWKGCSKLLN